MTQAIAFRRGETGTWASDFSQPLTKRRVCQKDPTLIRLLQAVNSRTCTLHLLADGRQLFVRLLRRQTLQGVGNDHTANHIANLLAINVRQTADIFSNLLLLSGEGRSVVGIQRVF